MKRYKEALADFNQALALDEQDTWAIASRGDVYRDMKRYKEALSDYDQALALGDQSDWILANREETYRLMEEQGE